MNDSARPLILVVLIFCSPNVANSQGTLEDYQRASRFQTGEHRKLITDAEVHPHWIEKSNKFWYRSVGPDGSQFVLVDSASNTSSPAFDHERLAAALTAATKREYKANKLPFETFEYVDNQKSIKLRVDAGSWVCDLANYKCTPASDDHNPVEERSPDGLWVAFVKDYNLFLRNASTGQVVQLTRDGVEGWDYATELPSLRLLEESGPDGYKPHAAVFWAPDSSKLVTYRLDSRNSGRFTSIQFVPPGQLRPKAFTYVYPLPGEALATAQPLVFEVPSGKRIDVKAPPIELPFQEGPGFEWFEDSKGFFYDYSERGYKSIELRVVDPLTGDEHVVIREQARTYVDPGESFYRFIHSTGEVVWASERDGWNHLYLYNEKTGAVVRQLTQGPWVVRGIVSIDEKSRRVYFLASGRQPGEDPYQTHLCSISLDGGDLISLTAEDANHTISISPDNLYFVDGYSRPDFPGQSVLRRTKDGSTVRTLVTGDANKLLATGWTYPVTFKGKSADEKYDLYALIWRPSNFDPAKKYPVIEHVYTGPQHFFVPKSFGGAVYRGGSQAVAELGFVVVMIDGRGTAGRSRTFHEFSYRNLGGSFEDHVAMIRQMAAQHSYMDASRVGIFGTSAGGYGAAHAMLVFPEFYRVGVTISGDHDARLDKAWWNELYQGYPLQADYADQSNVTMAARLAGHLLIEHGDMDDNVHPVETMRFVDALIKAGKDFDMLFVPNMHHGEANDYLVRRRWDYFTQYLAGVTPPHNFEIKPAADR